MGRRLNQPKTGQQTPWRGIFIGIIIVTIPFYMLGLGLWLFAPSPTAPTPTPTASPFLTFTPLGLDADQPATTSPVDVITTIIATQISTQAPAPTEGFAPATFVMPSEVPTFFITSTPVPSLTPTPTSQASPTSPATNTPLPTEPQPPTQAPPTDAPLLPPTNTPQGG